MIHDRILDLMVTLAIVSLTTLANNNRGKVNFLKAIDSSACHFYKNTLTHDSLNLPFNQSFSSFTDKSLSSGVKLFDSP